MSAPKNWQNLKRTLRQTLDRVRHPVRATDDGLLEVTARLAGRSVPVFARPGTIDATLARMIVCDESEYRLPVAIEPKVIFDIGANIGATSVYFAELFPQAMIHSFEPLPENLAVLRRNVSRYGVRVRVHPFGLSDVTGESGYVMSDDPHNFGGGGFVERDGDEPSDRTLPTRRADQVVDELGVTRVDLIKIDTEGSEWNILRTLPSTLLADAQIVLGELHGRDDWRVCQLMSGTHDLSVSKRLGATCFPFSAVRHDITRATLRRAA